MSIRAKIKSLLGLHNRRQDLQHKYPQYRIGRGSYGNPTILSWNEGASLAIGNFCSIADGDISRWRTQDRLGHNLSFQRVVVVRFCHVVKYRFEPAIIERLLSVAWWNWSDESIKQYLPFLLSTDINLFLDKAEHSA